MTPPRAEPTMAVDAEPEASRPRSITITIFPNEHETAGTRRKGTLQALYEEFAKTPPVAADESKEGRPMFSPAVFRGNVRKGTGVESISFICTEIDNTEKRREGPLDVKTGKRKLVSVPLPPEKRTSFDQAAALWVGTSAILYTTYSHTTEHPKIRVLPETTRPMTPEEYPRVRRWVDRKMLEAGQVADPQTKDLGRPWYFPIRRVGREFVVRRIEGAALDVDAILKETPPEPEHVAEYRRDTRLAQYIEETLRPAISMPELLQKHGEKLEAASGYHKMWAPFRDDGRKPGCVVWEDHFHDFGTGEHYDAVRYIREKLGKSFWEALDLLAEEAGVDRFPRRDASKPARIDPSPLIAALPETLPSVRRTVLVPVYRAIATQDPEDRRPHIDALLAKYKKVLDRDTIERGVREAEAERRAEDEADSCADDVATYAIVEGSLCAVRQTPAGAVHQRLVNGNVQIVEVITRDDGSDRTHDVFKIKASRADKTALPEFEVATEEFDRMEWLTPQTLGQLRMEPGRSTRDILRHAILTLSTFGSRTEYGDFGWRTVGKERVFLHAGGALGSTASVDVKPATPDLARFDLAPVQPDKWAAAKRTPEEAQREYLARAITSSLDLLDVAPARITYPLFASMMHSPVIEALPHRSVLLILGRSGVLKTALAFECQRYFGAGFRSVRDFVLNFESTATAIEIVGHALSGMLVVMDDAYPKGGRAGEQQRALCRKLVHNYANGATRMRGTASVELRASLPFRANLWMTAETDLATADEGESTANRALKIGVEPGDINVGKLTPIQATVHPHLVTRGYVEHLATQRTWSVTLPSRHREVLPDFRQLVQRGGLQARQPEVLASLYIAMESFLKFAHLAVSKTGVERDLPWERVEHLLKTTKEALIEVAASQTRVSKATSPLAKFIRHIISGISAGRAGLVKQDEAISSTSRCVGLGWFNDTHVLLLPDEVHRFVAEALRETEDRSLLPLRDYYQMMIAELGATQPTPSEAGRVGVKRKCGDRQERVLEIPIASFGDDAELLRRPTLKEEIAKQVRENERAEPPLGVGFDINTHDEKPN